LDWPGVGYKLGDPLRFFNIGGGTIFGVNENSFGNGKGWDGSKKG